MKNDWKGLLTRPRCKVSASRSSATTFLSAGALVDAVADRVGRARRAQLQPRRARALHTLRGNC